MHPSMYEDVLNHQSVDKSRSSHRLPMIKNPTCSCCNSVQTKTASPKKVGAGDCPKEPPLMNVELPAGIKTDNLSTEESCEKKVSVGPLFQADVPEWTGEVIESDSKWLGERMWPPEDVGDEMVIDLVPIGRGRPDHCRCLFPKTTECVRFHIAEKRLQLKHELGSLFYKWRFNHMGEEVSLSWTRDEENKFKEMLSLHSASTNKFWNNASKLFPSKSREMLISYYFNVFLIQRRNYQNRVTPKDIDSDDDEKKFGTVGERFGHKATSCPKSSLPICLENKQCADLE